MLMGKLVDKIIKDSISGRFPMFSDTGVWVPSPSSARGLFRKVMVPSKENFSSVGLRCVEFSLCWRVLSVSIPLPPGGPLFFVTQVGALEKQSHPEICAYSAKYGGGVGCGRLGWAGGESHSPLSERPPGKSRSHPPRSETRWTFVHTISLRTATFDPSPSIQARWEKHSRIGTLRLQ